MSSTAIQPSCKTAHSEDYCNVVASQSKRVWKTLCRSPRAQIIFKSEVMKKTGCNYQDFQAIMGPNPEKWIELDAAFQSRLHVWVESHAKNPDTAQWAANIEQEFYQAVAELTTLIGK